MWHGVSVVEISGKRVAYIGKCMQCGNHQRTVVTEEEHARYDTGLPIQEAIPRLDANEREWLISGICGRCFDEMFADE